jgi:CPA1 family monovalent cation:H+ antiporter
MPKLQIALGVVVGEPDQLDRGQVLTWGGLRGGISIALASSLPKTPERGLILAAPYAAVLFTILVQGLSLRMVAERLTRA